MVPRPLFGHGLVYVITDYERPELWAIRPDGQGDVTDTHVAWALRRGVAAKPSLLLMGDLLSMVTDEGIAVGIEAKTGELVWKERLRGNFSASPIYADGRLYCFNQDSVATVLEPGPPGKILAVNELSGEQLMATPAVAGKALFVRTRTHLYRIEMPRS